MKLVRQVGQVLIHPVETIEKIKREKQWSLLLSWIILILWFLVTVFSAYATDFKFNYEDPKKINTFYLLCSTIGLYLLFTLINWALTTLLDGKGTMKEIFCSFTFALVPWIGMMLINTLLSSFLLTDEQVFMTIISAIGILYSAGVFVAIMMAIHDFSLTKSLVIIGMTVVGIVFVLFLLILFFGLLQQVLFFFQTIIKEAQMRR